MSLLTKSDKFFWHHYIEQYDLHFSALEAMSALNILEIGIFKGNSIRWLQQKFPNANIHGIDILEEQAEWPQSEQITYYKMDVSNREALHHFFQAHQFDIIIEDSSHIPSHQAICLIEGIKRLKEGGFYILEDIHTSLPEHDYYHRQQRAKYGWLSKKKMGTALTALLGIEHLKRNQLPLTDDHLNYLARDNFLSAEE